MNPHTTLCAAGERIDEPPGHRAGLDEVHLEQHRFARGRDGLEHAPEDTVAVGEELEPVGLPPRPSEDGECRRGAGLRRNPDPALGTRHERLFYALWAALIALLLSPLPALANAVGSVNRARAACGAPAVHAPLRESRELDEVARRLARGESLEQAQRRAGYRAARSVWIRIEGATDDAAIERVVSRRFCGQLADPRLRRIGTYGRGGGGLWIVVAQPFTTPSPHDAAAVGRVVLALTNRARAHARVCGWRHFPPAPPLSLAPALARAARAHSRDMAEHDFFGHTGSDGSSPGLRVTRAGYRWRMVGENIASGVRTPQATVAAWLASPHHCANIMTAGYRQMGVGFAVDPANPQIIEWTEDFGTPR